MKSTWIGCILLALATPAMAQDETEMSKRVAAAMKADLRTEADTDRDRNRKPVATLDFFGINDGMKVLELLPARGWYTKLLAPALRDNGQLYVALGTTRLKDSLLGEAPFDRVKVLEAPESDIRPSEIKRLYTISPFSFGETGFDAVLTFRNVHNFDAAGRKALNEAAFAALKPGGIFGVVDHTRRHMEPFTAENRRRADPVQVIKETQAAGFEFVDYSDLHYRPDDELRYEVGRKSVTGNTDRFTFLFRKPE